MFEAFMVSQHATLCVYPDGKSHLNCHIEQASRYCLPQQACMGMVSFSHPNVQLRSSVSRLPCETDAKTQVPAQRMHTMFFPERLIEGQTNKQTCALSARSRIGGKAAVLKEHVVGHQEQNVTPAIGIICFELFANLSYRLTLATLQQHSVDQARDRVAHKLRTSGRSAA